jgi:hypothetical protein
MVVEIHAGPAQQLGHRRRRHLLRAAGGHAPARVRDRLGAGHGGAARRVIGGMTQALPVILEAGYAPIEQYADTPGAKQGLWTDLYALGAVVHQMINGSRRRRRWRAC